MDRKHTITFLIWLAAFNCPPVLIWVPFLRGLCFLPLMYWINVPAGWCGLGALMGRRHYVFEEFGALPQTPLAWTLIVLFWVLLSAVMSVVTVWAFGLLHRDRGQKQESTRATEAQP